MSSLPLIGHHIGGQPLVDASSRTQDVTHPATGAVTTRAALADAPTVEAAVAAACAAFLA